MPFREQGAGKRVLLVDGDPAGGSDVLTLRAMLSRISGPPRSTPPHLGLVDLTERIKSVDTSERRELHLPSLLTSHPDLRNLHILSPLGTFDDLARFDKLKPPDLSVLLSVLREQFAVIVIETGVSPLEWAKPGVDLQGSSGLPGSPS